MSETEENTVPSATSEGNEFVENGKNKFTLRCSSCGSKILEKQSGQFVILDKELPHTHINTQQTGEIPKEAIKDFIHVENMFTFENIGFTYEVDNCKYLSCADCDVGPLGFYDIGTKHSYIAIQRVTHK